MQRIYGDAMYGPSELCSLTFNHAPWNHVSVRQPGEYRNPRLAYSIGYKNFFASGIVSQGHWVTESCSRSAWGGIANDTLWLYVAIGSKRIDSCTMIAKVRHPKLIVLSIHINPYWMVQLRLGS